MLKLTFITKEQDIQRHEYTEDETTELACLANGIYDLSRAMSTLCFSNPDEACCGSIFDIFEILMTPIRDFLGEGCPMAEEKQEEQHESA
jgi:hypothetical protein